MLGAISYNPLVHIELGPLSISPHGIGIAIGFLAGTRLLLPVAREKGWDLDGVYACVTRAAIGSIVGARLAYAVNHASDFDSVLDVLKVWEGGISLLGGFFGAILFALPGMRKQRFGFWPVMDACVPGMALGVIIGRVGDLVVGDHLGKTTDFFLGYKCTGVETASPCDSGTIVHQTALYDLLFTTVLLFVLLRLRRGRHYAGFLTIVFGAWYGTQRIVEDFLREDVRYLGLTGSQITSCITVAICVTWLVAVRRTPRWGHWDNPAATGWAGRLAEASGPAALDEPAPEVAEAAAPPGGPEGSDAAAGPAPEPPPDGAPGRAPDHDLVAARPERPERED